MWSQTKINLGNVPSPSQHVIKITYTGTKEVQDIEPLCTCVGAKFDGETLILTWKIKPYPKNTDTLKLVAISYKDGTIEDIELRAHAIPTSN